DILIPEDKPVELTDDLSVSFGRAHSDFENAISGKTFEMLENPMGIRWFRLEFGDGEGRFVYENEQGEKTLPFGMKKNYFGKFPQLGYSDERGNVHEITGFKYDCAASAGWLDDRTLQLRVQIIDRYFGSLVATFGFRDGNTVSVRMIKHAEDFLNEYHGWMAGKAK
ncbi:MAG: hypothetical protein II266_08630, partial [Clostridia bacterium]|nr:hypothetical protein [Clostridia bacterium]